MSRTLKVSSLVIIAALTFTIMGQELFAQEGLTRVAVVIDLEEGFDGAGDVVDRIAESAREVFEERDGIVGLLGREVAEAQRQLDHEITENSSPPVIRQFADALNADVVVVITVNNLQGDQISLEVDAFSNRGNEIFDARSERFSENAEGQIGRFVTTALSALIEQLQS